MLRDIAIGQYYPGDSPVHRLDPRVKILVTLVYILVLFFVVDVAGYLWMTAFLTAAILVARIPLGYILRGLKPILVLLLFTAGFNLFLTPGEILWQWGPLGVSEEGIAMAARMGARLILLVVASSMLTLTTAPIELTDGMESLLRPYQRWGVPAHELAMMMTIALRFIPTLIDEADKIMKAQMARGADFQSGNLVARARGMIPLLVPLFVSAFRRADELAVAMEARCYRGGEGRTRLRTHRVGQGDWMTVALAVGMVIGVVLIRWHPRIPF